MIRLRVVSAGLAGAALFAGVAVAAPVSGTIGGPVTAVKSESFTLKSSLSPTGSSKVEISARTVMSEQAAGTRSDLRKGVCATALGAKNSKGVIAATRIMLSAPVKGKCATGFGSGGLRPSGPRPGRFYGGYPPPRGGPRIFGRGLGNFGFASGGIVAVDGSTLTIKNQQTSSTVTVSSKTQIVRTAHVGISSVKVGMCAFVRGTSSDRGITVSAQDVSLFTPGPNGCIATFRRP